MICVGFFLSSFCVLCSMVCGVSKWGPCCLSSFCVLSTMVCGVSKWSPCCLSSFCVLSSMVWYVSKWGPCFLSSFCVVSSMVCHVSKWVRVVYLRSVSCVQWCVMLVSGSVFFIFVVCLVLNGV